MFNMAGLRKQSS